MKSNTVCIRQEDLNLLVDVIIKIDQGEAITEGELHRLNELKTSDNAIKPTDSSYIGSLLKQLGVRPGILGYDYLKTAIKLVLEDRSLIHSVTKQLYVEIAKVHNTTPSRTERAIRHAVEVAFDNYVDDELRDAVFGNSTDARRGKPTNSHFIASVVEYLSEE